MGNEFAKKDLAEKRISANSPIVQRKPNNTGLPDSLKNGVESLSGMSMNDVRVHYNSAKPSQLRAHAYAQGTDIHIASGQESNLPHEAWHVAQQKQGRVTPTMQMKGSVVNDDSALEQEADTMGSKILQAKMQEGTSLSEGHASEGIVQLASDYKGIMPSHDITLDKMKAKNNESDSTFHRMELTYHHIIPEDILKEAFTQSLQPVYKYCLANKGAEGATELIQAVNDLLESGKQLREQTKIADGKESNNGEFTFSDSVKGDKPENIQEREQKRDALDGDLGAAIRWIPGNIHQGPKKRTSLPPKNEIKDKDRLAKLYTDGGDFNEEYIRDNPDVLSDDGGGGFEYAAINAVGKDRMKILAQLLTDLFKLPHFVKSKSEEEVKDINQYPAITTAIADVRKIITTINSLFYDQSKPAQQNGKKPLMVPSMDLDKWEKTEDKQAKDAKWTLKSDQKKQLRVQVKPGKSDYKNEERMFTKMSELAEELNNHVFLTNNAKVTKDILERDDVLDMELFLTDKAGAFKNMSIISYLRGWKQYNQDAYIKLMQNFKTASRKFLAQYADSEKKITGCVIVKSIYDKLYGEFNNFYHFFSRSIE